MVDKELHGGGGKFRIGDPRTTDKVLSLTCVKVNRGIMRKLAASTELREVAPLFKHVDDPTATPSDYLVSATLKNDATNEPVEVDFILRGADAITLKVIDSSVRKIGNQSFYDWKKQSNNSWVKVPCSEIPTAESSNTTKQPSDSNQPKQPKVVVCKQDVDAFNVSDLKQLGKFLAGSLLKVESKHEASGMLLVVYKQQDGSEVRALCRPQDISP